MFIINPSAYQFYDASIIVDGYHNNKQGSLQVTLQHGTISVSFWNYNCLAVTSRVLIIKTIDTSVYDTNKIVVKQDPIWTGSAATAELENIPMVHATTEGHKHCAAVAFATGSALSNIRKQKELNKLAILDKLRNKILFFQHSFVCYC